VFIFSFAERESPDKAKYLQWNLAQQNEVYVAVLLRHTRTTRMCWRHILIVTCFFRLFCLCRISSAYLISGDIF
jgi:hypothetical protein